MLYENTRFPSNLNVTKPNFNNRHAKCHQHQLYYFIYLVLQVDSAMRAAYGSDYISIVLSLPESSVKSSRKSRSVLGTEVITPIKLLHTIH